MRAAGVAAALRPLLRGAGRGRPRGPPPEAPRHGGPHGPAGRPGRAYGAAASPSGRGGGRAGGEAAGGEPWARLGWRLGSAALAAGSVALGGAAGATWVHGGDVERATFAAFDAAAPFLRLLDAEAAHHLAVWAAARGLVSRRPSPVAARIPAGSPRRSGGCARRRGGAEAARRPFRASPVRRTECGGRAAPPSPRGS